MDSGLSFNINLSLFRSLSQVFILNMLLWVHYTRPEGKTKVVLPHTDIKTLFGMETVEKAEFEIEEERPFVQKRQRNPNRSLRPVSIASQIISNPKLLKSVQDLEKGDERLSRYISQLKVSHSGEGDYEDRREWHKYLGISLALFASLVFSLGSIIVKSISEEYHPFSISVWTFQGILIPSLIVLMAQRICGSDDVFKGVWPLKSQTSCLNIFLLLVRFSFRPVS